MASSRLAELTGIISRETSKIDAFFAQHNLPPLSFDPSAPADFPVPRSNAEIQAARRAVVNATKELQDLMVGPRESLRWMSWNYTNNLSLGAIYEFKVAVAVPVDGEASYAEISKATGLDENNLKRLVRHAMTNHIFKEPREGFVAHTAASRLLIDDPQMIDWVGMCCLEFFPAAAHTVEAMLKYPNSQEPTESGFTVAWKCEGTPMFAELGKSPARAKRFGGAMMSLTGGEGYEVDYLVNGYPWSELGKSTFVDIGGSHGFVCAALAQMFPDMKFIVQDLPKTVADGPSKIPSELADRIHFQAHDFYTEQPVKDADVYFFRWIIHNQSDKYGVKILQALIPALKPGARIIINDNCLPKPNTADPWDEKITRTMDVTMLELLNARERDENDYAELFKTADPRFKFTGARTSRGCLMHIMEAIWDPESTR